MPWQDWVFTIGTTVFVFSMIPMLKAKHKPPLLTSVPSAFFLTIFAFTQLSLNLKFSAIATSVIASFWGILIYQKIKSGN